MTKELMLLICLFILAQTAGVCVVGWQFIPASIAGSLIGISLTGLL